MTFVSEKRNSTVSLTTPTDIKNKLIGLAQLKDMTLSEYALRVLIKHVEELDRETRIMAEALGININDI
jgi:hypothetical protein